MTKKFKVAMIIGPVGYQDTEFNTPYTYLTQNNVKVDVYSTKKGIAKGVFGMEFNVEHILDELDVGVYDAITFVGGPGTKTIRDDNNSTFISKKAFNENKLLAAICWSPTILAKAGVLKGKKATVWLGIDPEFNMRTSIYIEKKGAKYTREDVTIDGNIITANGPLASQKYAEAILKKLNENYDKIKK
jgi:protease I